MSYKTPLNQARGSGSAKSGVHHFMTIRFTSILLVPVILWFVYAIACLGAADVETARAFVGHPINACALILLLLAGFYHSALGIQVVLEDYVSHHGMRLTIQFLFNTCCFLLAIIGVIAVLKVAVGA